jgi:hypothetical protein
MLDPEMEVLHPGNGMEFVFEGTFTGQTWTLDDHAVARGRPHLSGDELHASQGMPPTPVMKVQRWCVRPPRGDERYAEATAFAAEHGLVCPN